jgi:hypothetical protein
MGPGSEIICVDPAHLESAVPGFDQASTECSLAAGWVRVWSDSLSLGLTDAAAATAWHRAMILWADDLGRLADALGTAAGRLTGSAAAYRQGDRAAGRAYQDPRG